jgi:hypothetical protein
MIKPTKWGKVKDTGVPKAHLMELSKRIFDISTFNAHPNIKKIFE